MLSVKRIPSDELIHHAGRVLGDVERGRTILVETSGREQAAIVEPLDLKILEAVVLYFLGRMTGHPLPEQSAGLPDSKLTQLAGQARIDGIIAQYLAGNVSLARAAEALGTSWLELRDRFSRLGLPLRCAPADEESARQDVLVAELLGT